MTKTALIVDDSRLACRVLAKMLESLNFTCSESYSAKDAIAQLNHEQPDIIFLDHNMPGMHGLEMMKQIKSKPLTANIPVMMHTAKEGDLYINQALALGAVDVLPKGLDKEHLAKALIKIGLFEKPSIQEKTSNSTTNIQTKNEPQIVSQDATKLSSWQEFWQQQLQPFLQKQNTQQNKEREYNTQQQTRKLTREMHVILEQFEHALVLRMESHADFVASTEKVARSTRRKWLALLGAALIVLQLVFFWQLWQNQAQTQALLALQKETLASNQTLNNKFSQLEQIITSLETNTQYLDQQLNDNQSSPVSLITAQGEFIADLLPIDEQANVFHGITLKGYQFHVDTDAIVGKAMPNRYYRDDNCQGEAFIKSGEPTVYKTNNEDLWYVTHKSPELIISVRSKRDTSGQCVEMQAQSIGLFAVTFNEPFETGLDSKVSFELHYNR